MINNYLTRMTTIALLLAVVVLLTGCGTPEPTRPRIPLHDEPMIRVLIREHTDLLTINKPATVRVCPMAGLSTAVVETPLELTFINGNWVLNTTPIPQFGRMPIVISPSFLEPLVVDEQPYPGYLVLVGPKTATTMEGFGGEIKKEVDGETGEGEEDGIEEGVGGAENRDVDEPLDFDVINHVHIEAYLPGVLARELYDDWHLATYHAQAIAARSYAIYQIQNAPRHRVWDVKATQASQAYIGKTEHPKSISAVHDTVGLVLSWKDSIIPAYYSSTCGGAGVSAAQAFGGEDIPPLNATPHHPWCNRSPHFNWGPVTRKRDTLSKRIAAWGRANNLPIAELGLIRSIRATSYNVAGRPVMFELTDDLDGRYDLRASRFRVACNYTNASDEALATLEKDLRLKSSYFDVSISKTDVIFDNCHGFGHGVGMCQYGAESMAEAGFDAIQILDQFYHGARVQRAY